MVARNHKRFGGAKHTHVNFYAKHSKADRVKARQDAEQGIAARTQREARAQATSSLRYGFGSSSMGAIYSFESARPAPRVAPTSGDYSRSY